MSNLIKTDMAYKNWTVDVSKRFRQSQLKLEKCQQDADDSVNANGGAQL